MKGVIGEFIVLVFSWLFSLAIPVEMRFEYITSTAAYFIVAYLLLKPHIKAVVIDPMPYMFLFYAMWSADVVFSTVVFFISVAFVLVFGVYVYYVEYAKNPPRFNPRGLAGFWINASASSVVYYIFAGVGPPLLLSLLLASVLHVGTRGAGHAYVVPWLSSLLSLATPSWGSALAAAPYVVAAVAYRMTASRTEPHKHAS
ncbi:MAG: hypothetical protein QXY12_05705 [Pyrobaculum sp.]